MASLRTIILVVGLGTAGLVVATQPTTAQQQACDPWSPADVVPTERSLFSVAYGNGRFVAVGRTGTIVVSDDATTWSAVESGTSHDLWDVAWCGSFFAACGNSGVVLTSWDGSAWHTEPTGVDTPLYGVAGTLSSLVVVGAYTVIIRTAADGWRVASTGDPLSDVVWTGKSYIAVGGAGACDGHPLVVTSPDGTAWSRLELEDEGWLRGVASDESEIAAVGEWPSPAPFSGCIVHALIVTVPTSADLRVARLQTPPLYGVVRTESGFLVCGYQGYVASTGPDGTWNEESVPSRQSLLGVAVSPLQRVVVGANGTILHSRCAELRPRARRRLSGRRD